MEGRRMLMREFGMVGKVVPSDRQTDRQYFVPYREMMTRLGKEKRVRNNTMNKMNKMDNMNHMNHMNLGWEGKRKQGSK